MLGGVLVAIAAAVVVLGLRNWGPLVKKEVRAVSVIVIVITVKMISRLMRVVI